MEESVHSKKGPLSGIRIVDLTAVIMGPYAMQILSDYGAEIIKIEVPSGDVMRFNGKHGDVGMGPMHLTLNRGKKLLALDLKQPEAREVLFDLVKGADAFVHAMRPKAIARLGLDYKNVSAANPDILYCGAYGFSVDGPYSDHPAYDDLIQGVSGFSSLAANLAGEPRYFPTALADKVCGLAMTHSLLAGLLHKERTGEGQEIEVPMFETMVQFIMTEHLFDCTFGLDEEIGYSRILSQLRKPHRTTDGYVCVLPYQDKNWRDFFTLVGSPETAMDPRYSSHSARSQNYGTLYPLLAEYISQQSTGYWLEKLRELNIPVEPILGLKDLFQDEHLKAVGMFNSVEHPDFGEITAVRPATNFSKTPAEIGAPAGIVGQDSTKVLEDLGYTRDRIERLLTTGAVVQGTRSTS